MLTVTNAQGIGRGVVPTTGTYVPPPPPPPPPVTHPSGFDLPTANLTNFDLVYIEDFLRPVTEDTLTTNGSAALFDKLYGVEPNNDLAGGVKIEIGSYPSNYLSTFDRGRYGSSILSVAPGSSILNLNCRYEAGWPRVAAWYPHLGKLMGQPYGANDVLGGAMEFAWKCDIMPTYKYVPLWWPRSNTSQTPDRVNADGEIDFPEFNCWNNSKIAGWTHHQGDLSGDGITEQTGWTSPTVNGAGTGWHKTRMEWIPGIPAPSNPVRSIGGSVRYWLDGALMKTIIGSTDGVTGSFIPMHPMHLIMQFECWLGAQATDQTVTGTVQVDWIACYQFKGTPGQFTV